MRRRGFSRRPSLSRGKSPERPHTLSTTPQTMPKRTFPDNDDGEDSYPDASPAHSQHTRKRLKRPALPNRIQATVYDAVASRISYEGFIKPPFLNEFGEERVRSGVARPADEVLARRRRAPEDIAPLGYQGLSESRLPDNVRVSPGVECNRESWLISVGSPCGDSSLCCRLLQCQWHGHSEQPVSG